MHEISEQQAEKVELKVSDESGTETAASAADDIEALQNYARGSLRKNHEDPRKLVRDDSTGLVVAVDAIDINERHALTLAVPVCPLLLVFFAIMAIMPIITGMQHAPVTDGSLRRTWESLGGMLPLVAIAFPCVAVVGNFVALKHPAVGEAILNFAFLPARLLQRGYFGTPLAGRCLAQLLIARGKFKAARRVLRTHKRIAHSAEAKAVRLAQEAHIAAALGEFELTEKLRAEAYDSEKQLTCEQKIRTQIARVIFNHLGASCALEGKFKEAYEMYAQSVRVQSEDQNKFNDAVELSSAVIGAASAAACLGRSHEAQSWLATLGEYEHDMPPYMMPRLATATEPTAHITALMARLETAASLREQQPTEIQVSEPPRKSSSKRQIVTTSVLLSGFVLQYILQGMRGANPSWFCGALIGVGLVAALATWVKFEKRPRVASVATAAVMALFGCGVYALYAGHSSLNGLTPYECYRWGAEKLAYDWRYTPRFNNVKEVREAWTRAATAAPNDFAGKLAASALQSELPSENVSVEDMNAYGQAAKDDLTLEQQDTMLQACIKTNPQFEWPLATLAKVRVREHKLDEAEKLLQQAAAINPKSMQYLLARADLEIARGNRKAAVSTLLEAQKLDPFLPQPYAEMLGTILGLN